MISVPLKHWGTYCTSGFSKYSMFKLNKCKYRTFTMVNFELTAFISSVKMERLIVFGEIGFTSAFDMLCMDMFNSILSLCEAERSSVRCSNH